MSAQNFNDDELRGEPPVDGPATGAAGVMVVSNPFGVAKPLAVASAESDVARAVTEVQAAMLIARKFPRDERAAMDKILNAFARPGLAEKAAYQYARGGTDIVGPSIRAAETIAQCWGNIYTGVRELEQRGGASTVEAFAWDTETGFHDIKVFQVPHMRHTRNASYKIEDPRDIYEHVANAAARRKRACILAVIPSDVVESAMRQAEVTLTTTAEATPEKIAALVKAFGDEFEVPKDALEKRIQRRIDAITPAQMVSMRRIFASLRDGMSRPDEWFEMAAPADGGKAATSGKPAKGTEGLKAAREKAAGSGTTSAAGSVAGTAVTTDATGGAGGQGDANAARQEPPAGATGTAPGPTYVSVMDALHGAEKAGDTDAADLAADLISHIANEAQRAELDTEYRRIRKALTKA